MWRRVENGFERAEWDLIASWGVRNFSLGTFACRGSRTLVFEVLSFHFHSCTPIRRENIVIVFVGQYLSLCTIFHIPEVVLASPFPRAIWKKEDGLPK